MERNQVADVSSDIAMRELVILAGLVCGAASAQDSPPTFRAGVSLVRVDAEVVQGATPVPNLAANHFVAYDNGVAQKVVKVVQEQEPMDVVLLFDVSGSMRQPVARAAAAARKALDELRKGDRVAVIVFASNVRMLCPFTEDLERVRRVIQEDVLGLPFEGATYILDAVAQSTAQFLMERKPDRRRALLVVTDNFGQVHEVEEREALTDLLEADVVLAGLIVRNPREGSKRERRRVGVDRLAEETGGDAVRADDPGMEFASLMERLRMRYSIYYEMPKGTPGEMRQVRLELQGQAKALYPEARIRARKGYRLPEQAQ